MFGFLWFVGKAPPAPEYQPYKRSWQFALLAKMAPATLVARLDALGAALPRSVVVKVARSEPPP